MELTDLRVIFQSSQFYIKKLIFQDFLLQLSEQYIFKKPQQTNQPKQISMPKIKID